MEKYFIILMNFDGPRANFFFLLTRKRLMILLRSSCTTLSIMVLTLVCSVFQFSIFKIQLTLSILLLLLKHELVLWKFSSKLFNHLHRLLSIFCFVFISEQFRVGNSSASAFFGVWERLSSWNETTTRLTWIKYSFQTCKVSWIEKVPKLTWTWICHLHNKIVSLRQPWSISIPPTINSFH